VAQKETDQLIEGNFFETVPSGADAYVFLHILHDWTDEQCRQILGLCRNVIPRHGKLLVVECVIPMGNDRSSSKDFDMTMMVFPRRTRTDGVGVPDAVQTDGLRADLAHAHIHHGHRN
jgi:hypothetical protein